jgi:hypothetical protein
MVEKEDKRANDLPDREILKKQLLKYRGMILEKVQSVNNLMALLMKGSPRKWTRKEKEEIKAHFLQLSKSIPLLMVFLLPGGFILMPLLLEMIDRRKKNIPITEERRKTVDKMTVQGR